MQAGIRLDCTRWRNAAHILSTPDLAVPICLDRHNFATELFAFLRPAPDTWTSAEATEQQRPRESRARHLPKSWASAGAFSLLTPRS